MNDTERQKAEVNRAILILQLYVSFLESSDLNDEDIDLMASLAEHSVVKMVKLPL